jgi:hypothetical protein
MTKVDSKKGISLGFYYGVKNPNRQRKVKRYSNYEYLHYDEDPHPGRVEIDHQKEVEEEVKVDDHQLDGLLNDLFDIGIKPCIDLSKQSTMEIKAKMLIDDSYHFKKLTKQLESQISLKNNESVKKVFSKNDRFGKILDEDKLRRLYEGKFD